MSDRFMQKAPENGGIVPAAGPPVPCVLLREAELAGAIALLATVVAARGFHATCGHSLKRAASHLSVSTRYSRPSWENRGRQTRLAVNLAGNVTWERRIEASAVRRGLPRLQYTAASCHNGSRHWQIRGIGGNGLWVPNEHRRRRSEPKREARRQRDARTRPGRAEERSRTSGTLIGRRMMVRYLRHAGGCIVVGSREQMQGIIHYLCCPHRRPIIHPVSFQQILLGLDIGEAFSFRPTGVRPASLAPAERDGIPHSNAYLP